MILAWVLSMILVISSIIGYLEHSAALKIQLLAIEEEAHREWVLAEKGLLACEAQVRDGADPVESMRIQLEARKVFCDYHWIDQASTGKLIRVVATVATLDSATRSPAALESIVYVDLITHGVTRASWRWVDPDAEN